MVEGTVVAVVVEGGLEGSRAERTLVMESRPDLRALKMELSF